MAKLCHVRGLLGVLGDLNVWLPSYLDLAYSMPTMIVDAMFTLDRPPGRGACSGSGMGGLCTGVSATLYTDSFLYM